MTMNLRKTVFFGIFILLAVFNIIVLQILNSVQNSDLQKVDYKKIKVKDMVFSVPDFFNPAKIEIKGEWTIRNFSADNLLLRISTAKGNQKGCEKIIKILLGINSIPQKGYFSLKNLYFLKPLPLVENGIYVIKHRNKSNVYVFVFHKKDTIYYIDLVAPGTISKYKDIFDNIVISIVENNSQFRLKDTEKTKKELKNICKQSLFIICQTETAFILLLPGLIAAFIFVLFYILTRNMGALPQSGLSELTPIYSEENLDAYAKIRFKRQWLAIALAVNNEGLHLFYRKKPLLFISKIDAAKKLKFGKSFWGEFAEVNLEGTELSNPPLNFRINKPKQLRFYPKNCEQIKSLLEIY